MKMEEKIITDLSIKPIDKGNLKSYFNSLKRNLPKSWIFHKDEKYIDIETFKILNDIVCLQTPYLRNDNLDLTFYAKIFLGITDNEIFIIKVTFSEEIKMPDRVFAINHIVEMFKQEILEKNKYYSDFTYNLEFGGPSDENFESTDLRNERMLRIHSKSDNRTYTLAKGSQANIGNQKVLFFPPNNISLTLSLMKKAYKKAFIMHKDLIRKKKEKTIKLEEDSRALLFDYFEEIVSSVIFAYISVEAMANAAIPEDYKLEKVNEKGIKEIWSKENIERWMPTSQKVTDILPSILNSGDIKTEKFWNNFKELEKLRNDLIHQKTVQSGTKLDSDIFQKLLKQEVFLKIKSAVSVIKYFYDLDNSHPYFPLGLGIAKVIIKEVDDIGEYFGKLEEVK